MPTCTVVGSVCSHSLEADSVLALACGSPMECYFVVGFPFLLSYAFLGISMLEPTLHALHSISEDDRISVSMLDVGAPPWLNVTG